MKILSLSSLSIAIMVVGLLSCKKDSGNSTSSQETVLKYTYNGTTYQLKGSLSGAATTGSIIGKDDVTSTFISLLIQDSTSKPISSYTGIPIIKSTSNLTATGTYTITDYIVELHFNFGTYIGKNSYSVTITSIGNGMASGTFTCSNFTKFSGSGPSTVSIAGEFSNVKIQ